MRLNKIDITKINKGKPHFLRLYDIQSVTDEELAFISDIQRYVPNVSASNCCNEIMEAINLQYGNIIKRTDKFIMAKKSEWYVELYITTKCNLACNSCAQFSQFKSTWIDMPMEQIDKFIEDNKHRDLTVNILGGEPTVHPHLDDIILKLDQYFTVMLATNGIIPYTPPIPMTIENTSKSKGVQPVFSTTMEAPRDLDKYKNDDFSLGCFQAGVCGYGYNTSGYYACPIAGAIDKRLGFNMGAKSLDEAKLNASEQFEKLCGYCGTYKTKNFIHHDVPECTTEQIISKSWEFMKDVK